MRNAVSGSLDLSGLYGRGLVVDSHLYDSESEGDTTLCRFPMGLPGVSDKQVKCPVDGAIERARDVPRIDASSGFLSVCGQKAPYRPLIGDPRNDDNLILSQLQCALMQVHNRLVDLQIARHAASPQSAFDQARLYLTSVYRRVVVDDYLRRILSPAVWAHFFDGEEFRGPGVASLKPLADLPMEFTFGASRFAHAMIRDRYALNSAFDEEAGTLREILAFSSQRPNGDVPVRVNWAVDWSRFIESGDAKALKARRISPFLTYEMAVVQHTADFDGVPRSIAFMDCWRCYDLGIASGQTIAGAVAAALSADVAVLSGEGMLPTDNCRKRYGYQAGALEKTLRAHPQFLTETPLSYYVMQEAAVLGDDGNRLGPTGSFIVARRLHRAVGQTLCDHAVAGRADSEAAGRRKNDQDHARADLELDRVVRRQGDSRLRNRDRAECWRQPEYWRMKDMYRQFLKAAADATDDPGSETLAPDIIRFTFEYGNPPDPQAERAKLSELIGSDRFAFFPLPPGEDPLVHILQFPNVRREQSAGFLFEVAQNLIDDCGLRSCVPDVDPGWIADDELNRNAPESVGGIVWTLCKSSAPVPTAVRWAISAVRADRAWARFGTTGQGILIGQPDTGVADHRELDGAVDLAKGTDILAGGGLPIDPLASSMSSPGHGTATSSTVVSRPSLAIVGAAPGATLVPIRCVNSVVIGSGTAVAAAVDHARLAKCHVITMSLGGPLEGADLRRAIERAVKADMIVLAAAGNCIPTVVYPAWDRQRHRRGWRRHQ